MTDNREKLLNKIRALLSKTVENGCTEAETMSALSMAQAMMDAHEVTEDDVRQVTEDKAVIDYSSPKDTHKIGWRLCYGVAKFTETYSYGNPARIKFAGLKSDVEFAIWLNETLVLFIRSQLKDYLWANNYTGLNPSAKRKVINGFIIGCAQRITKRLMEMSSHKKSINANALVVAKDALIKEALKDIKIKAEENRGRKTQMYSKSYEAGQSAGDKANFGRLVGSGMVLRLK